MTIAKNSKRQLLNDALSEILKEIENNKMQLDNALYILKISIEHGHRHRVDDLCNEITDLNNRIIILRNEYDTIASIL